MALQLSVRRPAYNKIAGIFVAVFALVMHPFYGLNLSSVFATTASITKLSFITPAQEIVSGRVSNIMTVQAQNTAG